MIDPNVKAYLSSIGKKGGQKTGDAKVRGDAEHYRKMSEKAAKARKAKGKAKKAAKKK